MMQHTGYALVDGDPSRGIAAATARHWVVCAVLVIVAQWLLGMLVELTNFSVRLIPYITFRTELGTGSSDWLLALSSVAWLVVPFGLVALGAIWLSQRFDERGPVALGLQWRAIPEAIPWAFAGVIVSSLVVLSFFRLAPGWPEVTFAALLWLVPATLIQAGAEEILFRGALLTMLVARYGALRGVLISSALFALWHLYAGQGVVDAGMYVVTTFVLGACWAILALHQGHLGGAIALHVVWNLISDVDAGLVDWTGAHGVLGMFDGGFWQSYIANANRPWMTADLQSSETIRETFIPLLIQTTLILAACRGTVEKLLRGPVDTTQENPSTP